MDGPALDENEHQRAFSTDVFWVVLDQDKFSSKRPPASIRLYFHPPPLFGRACAR